MKQILHKLFGHGEKTSRHTLIFLCSGLIRAALIGLFLILNRPWLSLLNAVSLLLYGLLLPRFNRGQIGRLDLTLLYLDVTIHSGINNLLLGMQTGFFLYGLLLIPLTYYLSVRELSRRDALVGSALLSVLTIAVMILTLLPEPRAPLTDRESRFVLMVNITVSIGVMAIYSRHFITKIEKTEQELSFYANFDALTGLRNRYSVTRHLNELHGDHYCVAMGDIDDFKLVNDTYGHEAGDAILLKIGKLMQRLLPDSATVCRWGGEEFLLILRDNLPTSRALIEQIRRELPGCSVTVGDKTLSVTMTFGLADSLESDDFDRLTVIADENLYWGKRNGKNRIISSQDLISDSLCAHPKETELNCVGLTDPVFSALAATSDVTYIYICNMDTNVSRWSRNAVDYFGLPDEYMEGADRIWLEHIHPEDQQLYLDDINAVFSGKKTFHDVSYRARNREGRYVRCVCRGLITPGDMTHPSLFAGTMTNLGFAE